MARKARRRTSAGAKGAGGAAAPPRERIIDALMARLAARSLGRIGLGDIAEEAGVSLGALRETYDGKLDIVADFSRRIDRIVLDGGPAEGDTIRDRLFDVLMRRFDALTPHKDAIRSLTRSARSDLCLGRFLHRNAQRSMKWMLVAAGGGPSGVLGAVAIEGLVLVNAEALRVWLDDEDPGLAKTMAALDRGLDRGDRVMKVLDRICTRLRPPDRREGRGEASAAA